MGDRTWAELRIGGDIARERIGELARLLEEGIGSGKVGDCFQSQIEEAATAGECLCFEDSEANYGRFGIEDRLAELGLSYDLQWNTGIEFAEGEDRFRAGTGETRTFATSYGEFVVSADAARQAIESIDRKLYSEAREMLRRALSEDVTELPPLRIIES